MESKRQPSNKSKARTTIYLIDSYRRLILLPFYVFKQELFIYLLCKRCANRDNNKANLLQFNRLAFIEVRVKDPEPCSNAFHSILPCSKLFNSFGCPKLLYLGDRRTINSPSPLNLLHTYSYNLKHTSNFKNGVQNGVTKRKNASQISERHFSVEMGGLEPPSKQRTR